MWWPSFLEVMRDLWFFVLGKRTENHHAHTPNNQVLTARRLEPPTASQTRTIQLVEGQRYSSTDHDVVNIRESLSNYDSHLVQKAFLTMREWLLYTVLVKHAAIPLLALQMTPIGSWHVTLKGQRGVTIGITPYSGAIMEWGGDKQSARAALVLHVTPEETITIGQLGVINPGEYTKQTLTKKEWKELRPVFTTIA